ncbi:UNVERIFIED_ORG: integrase [Rhizobium esperanzae]
MKKGPITQRLTSEEYHDLLSRHIVPSRVFATKPRYDSPETDWCFGEDRDLAHNCWWIVVGDENEVRRPKCIAAFDSIVDRYGKRLSDDSLRSDLLTKKIICIKSLVAGTLGRPISAPTVLVSLKKYDWFVRWRLSLGIKKTSSLKRIHFDDFVKRLTDNEVIDLVPWRERVSDMFEKARSGALGFQITDPSFRTTIAWEPITSFLGLTQHSISTSRAFRNELRDHFAEIEMLDSDRVALSSSLETPGYLKNRGTLESQKDGRKSQSKVAYLNTWAFLRFLSVQRLIDHDDLKFDPYKLRPLRTIAEEAGDEAGRTQTIHPDDFVRLLQLSAKWVAEYAPYICKGAEMLRDRTGWPQERSATRRHRQALEDDLNSERPSGAPLIALLWSNNGSTSERREDHVPVGIALKYLQIAAVILICCFTARRLNEVLSLKAGCLGRRGATFYLNTFIHKTIRATLEIPVPEIVCRAVEMLTQMSASTREATGEQWLFRVAKGTLKKRSFVGKKLDKDLNEFVNFNQLSPPRDREGWTLASHQFRRGFAVFFFHGFEWATIESLSLYLGHYDPAMTEVYVNEVLAGEIGRFRDEIEARRRVDRAGRSSKEIKEIRDVIARLQEVVSDFGNASVEAYVLKMLKVHREEDRPIGRGAPKLIQNLREAQRRAQAFVRIGSRSNSPELFETSLIDELKKQVFTHSLQPTPDRSAMCQADRFNNSDLLTRECHKMAIEAPAIDGQSASDRTAAQIIRAFSSTNPCLKCIHGCLFKHNRQIVDDKRGRLTRARDLAATSASRQAADELLLEFEQNIEAAEKAAMEAY